MVFGGLTCSAAWEGSKGCGIVQGWELKPKAIYMYDLADRTWEPRIEWIISSNTTLTAFRG